VYNIEVEGDHCYRVGQQGILVHNQSAPCSYNLICGCDLFGPAFDTTAVNGVTPSNGKWYGPLDPNDPVVGARATGIKARLCNANATGGSRPTIGIAGWMTGYGGRIARAHLLGEQLGGRGDIPRNLVVTCRDINNRMLQVENTVRGWVNQGLVVDYEVSVTYSGTNPYPRMINMRASAFDPRYLQSAPGTPACRTIKTPIQGELNINACS
jgi:hypothetical protein